MKKQISLKLFFAFLLLSIFSILLFGCGNKDAFAGIGIVITERYKWSNVERPYQTVSKSNRINNKRGNIDLKYSAPIHYTVKIPANRPWIKTKIYLKKNDIVRIYCKGKVMPGAFEYRYKNTSCLAEGYHFTRSNFTVLPNANYMAAIGKIGNRDAFYIGSGKEFISYVNGPLYLGINDLKKSVYTNKPINKRSIYWKDNTGYYQADVYVYRK